MKPKTSLIIFIIFFGLVLGSIIYFSSQRFSPKTKPTSAPQLAPNEALLILKMGNTQRWFKGEVTNGMTVSQAILASALGANLKVKVNSTLEAVEGFQNTEQKKWKCYLNGKEINEKLDQTEIHPQDKILCEYK